jgi:hypothetical protein
MTRNLETRIEALEQGIRDNDFVPGLIFWRGKETLEEAKKRYEALHNIAFSDSTPVVELVTIDASSSGGNREVVNFNW